MDLDDSRQRRGAVAPNEQEHRPLRRDFPLEEAQKNYHTILEQQTARAEEELRRPARALFLSGLTAGLDLGFGPFAMAVSSTLLRDTLPAPLLTLLNANFYAIGFVFVVLGYSALFTEQTTSAVQPVLARREPVVRLLRLWAIVLGANLTGAALFAGMASILGPALGIIDAKAFAELSAKVTGHASWVILISGIAAGWLMGLLSWVVTAARDTTAQLIAVWLTTGLIGLAGLHHSIAGTVEVLMQVFVGDGAGFFDFLRFLCWSVLGNAIGGVFFVAGLKFGHTRESAA